MLVCGREATKVTHVVFFDHFGRVIKPPTSISFNDLCVNKWLPPCGSFFYCDHSIDALTCSYMMRREIYRESSCYRFICEEPNAQMVPGKCIFAYSIAKTERGGATKGISIYHTTFLRLSYCNVNGRSSGFIFALHEVNMQSSPQPSSYKKMASYLNLPNNYF